MILLRDAEAFERFQPRDSRGKRRTTGGYFSRRADANFIVMPVSRGEDQSIYPLFIQAIASWRAGRPADAEAALRLAEEGEISDWTRSVLRYLQGSLEEAEFLRAAGSIGEQTEARTYIGFKIALAGREDEALAHFRWVADRGAKTLLEYDLARSELNRLKYRNRTLPAQ